MAPAASTIPPMLSIRGRYERTWTGQAHLNLAAQIPLIASTFPEITRVHPATVNVRLDVQLIVAGVDHRTPPLEWVSPGEDGETGEVFDFVRVSLTFERLGLTVPGLLVVSHWSPHRLDAQKHEFLLERFVEGLADGDAIAVRADREVRELGYSKVRRGDGEAHVARTVVIV